MCSHDAGHLISGRMIQENNYSHQMADIFGKRHQIADQNALDAGQSALVQ